MNKTEREIISSVDHFADDILDFTRRLVAESSILGNEAPAMGVMEAELKKLSFDPGRILIDPVELSQHPGSAPVPWSYDGRYNVAARREASAQGGQSVIFNGHLDVVSPEPVNLWDRDPYDPVERDGWLYGRGAGDMKSCVAAMTYAVHAVEKAGFGFKAPFTIEAVIEEECGGNGALACVAAGHDAAAVLIPEPMGFAMLTAQLGVLWFKVDRAPQPCAYDRGNDIDNDAFHMSAAAGLNSGQFIRKRNLIFLIRYCWPRNPRNIIFIFVFFRGFRGHIHQLLL